MISDDLKKLPDTPGVYLMKNDFDQVIYVGKAVNLKNRVRQYFNNSKKHSVKVEKMVENIETFEYIITKTEVEALVLECNLIKKYNPKYNIRLKDDKHYPYIRIDVNNTFPKATIVRSMKKDGAKYFGPYTDAGAVSEIMQIIKKAWPLRTCTRKLPIDTNKERACLNYHLGNCVAPCIEMIDQTNYKHMIDEVVSFLGGNYKEVIHKLEEQMQVASDEMNFEKAIILRDQIRAIYKIEQKQTAINSSMNDQDIVAFARGEQDTLIQVYFVRQGKLIGREHFLFTNSTDETIETVFRDFILQFYANATFIPKEIIVEKVPEEFELLEQYLSDKKGVKVTLKLPQKGVKHNLLELASQNAYVTFSQFGDKLKKQQERNNVALTELVQLLNLDDVPNRIEAYDISNTAGVQSVGAMVVFEGGTPKRSDYRKYKIKTVIGPNDYASMEEIIERRISRAENILPDLFCIDGGKGQVGVVSRILKKYNIEIPVCGMIKDDKHKTRGLFFEGKELDMQKNSESFKLVTRIQDEVHRFAIEYHKSLRAKNQVQSILDNIDGVGKKRKEQLINYFGSVNNIKEATVEEIEKVEGISNQVATNIYKYFHK
ncbi:MAG: excinuclease ABC subunit C [Epulopiscium sp. Nele67-Bin004]|nr:MAG: excinuclease ABC subunit C [Epulopiscium sp. Nele67-Bin004]